MALAKKSSIVTSSSSVHEGGSRNAALSINSVRLTAEAEKRKARTFARQQKTSRSSPRTSTAARWPTRAPASTASARSTACRRR